MVLATQAGAGVLGASSLKAALDTDWDDPTTRGHARGVVLAALESVAVFVAAQPQVPPGASAAVAVARQVCAQDVQVTPMAPRACGTGWPAIGGSAWKTRTCATAARRGRP